MRKIRLVLTAILFVAFCTSVSAAEATVTFVSGKVEVQRDGKWIALQKGDTVSKSETISTGFQSEVKLKVLDSVMYLGPVTRITLEELSSSGSQDKVNVYLKTGTARSQVKHVDNKRVDYKVHTPVAVASCRGTEWIIDDSNNLICIEGVVAVAAYNPAAEAVNTDSDDTEESEESEESSEADNEESAEGNSSEEKNEATAEKDAVTEKEGGEKSTAAEAATPPAATGADRPTSDEGVIVKANQSVKVSQNTKVSAPVKEVVKTANTIKSSVASAAAKTAVGGNNSAPVETPKAENPMEESEKIKEATKNTGRLIIRLKLE